MTGSPPSVPIPGTGERRDGLPSGSDAEGPATCAADARDNCRGERLLSRRRDRNRDLAGPSRVRGPGLVHAGDEITDPLVLAETLRTRGLDFEVASVAKGTLKNKAEKQR